MKVNNVIRFFVLLLVISSCGSKKNRFGEFPETIFPTARYYPFGDVYMRYPYRVRLFDSTLYIADLHGDEYLCHAFAYPSMRHKQSFAKRGRGPGEHLFCTNIAVNSRGIVYLLNSLQRRISSYDPDSDSIGLLVELPEDKLVYRDFTLYNDTTFIFPDYYGESRFFYADILGNIFNPTGTIPENIYTGKVPQAALGEAWQSFAGCNTVAGIVAFATLFGEVIEIYDLNNDNVVVRTGRGGEPKCRFYGNQAINEGIMGYSDIFVGKQYIYAVFWGHDIEKMIEKNVPYQGGKYIHVFDFEGNPVRKYELDKYIMGLYVDELHGEIIGTDVNEEQLVVFDL